MSLSDRLKSLSLNNINENDILKYYDIVGESEWDLYEAVCVAEIGKGHMKEATSFLRKLEKKFGTKSKRVLRLIGMHKEANEKYDEARQCYKQILERDATDVGALKRLICIEKAQGNIDKALELLNEYLELYAADESAWQEMAELYISQSQYEMAKFCYEELILLAPNNYLYHLLFAECLYTLGKVHFISARQHFAQSLELKPNQNVRALYGLIKCLDNQQKTLSKTDLALRKLAINRLNEEYSENSDSELKKLVTTSTKK